MSTGNTCQLALTYAPTALTSGTVTLDYGYTSPAGAFTTGSLNIPYAATTNDNIVATAAPSGQIDAIVGEVNPNLTVTFTTDDARPVTALAVDYRSRGAAAGLGEHGQLLLVRGSCRGNHMSAAAYLCAQCG